MSVKRPRIDPELAERIDRARGLVPFEPYVNDALRQHFNDWPADLETMVANVPTDELLHFLFMEGYGFHWPDFKAAVDREHERWQRAADEAAVEQEHEE